MLEDLLHGQEKSQCVLITDTATFPGRVLLLNWIQCLTERSDEVIMVCSERPPEFYTQMCSANMQKRISCISSRCDRDHPEELDNRNLLDRAGMSLSRVKGHAAIVVDSLTLQILHRRVPATCSSLHRLATDSRVNQVVVVLHRDVHDANTTSLVQHVASSVIELRPGVGGRHVCHITHQRLTGKVFKTMESFSIDESFHIQDIGPFQKDDCHKQIAQQSPQQTDPTADLSFSLSLTETEKVARSQVKLPYLKDGSEETQLSPSVSRIHYEPEEEDDLDEEDPDDDLNI